MNRFFKNFIMCGDSDYHCLLCEENFNDLAAVEKHIRWEKHRTTVKNQNYFSKFQKEYIFKVKDAFYCEACNYLLYSFAEAFAHIKEENHASNKKTPISDKIIENNNLKYNEGYIIISDFIVSDQEWHTIIHDKCLLCLDAVKYTVTDTVKHMTSTKHLLNLIKAKITRVGDSDFYRKINGSLFYCFVCKRTITLDTVDTHWTETDHCDKKKSSISRVTSTVSTQEDKKKILAKKLIDTQKIYYNINEDNGAAVCKECQTSVRLDFKDMLDHQKGHDSKTINPPLKEVEEMKIVCSDDEAQFASLEARDSGLRRALLAKYGKQHFIKLNAGGSRGYCFICHATLSASHKIFIQHVRGTTHRAYLELKGVKKRREHKFPNVKIKGLIDYFKILYYSHSMHLLWINKSLCVDVMSFIMVAPIAKTPHFAKTRCFVCDVLFNTGEEEAHFKTQDHKLNFLSTRVLSVKQEFIREIRRDLYHCGVCGLVYPFWERIEKHLKSRKHLLRKSNANIVQRLAQKWYKDTSLVKSSECPDILYVQLTNLGMFVKPKTPHVVAIPPYAV